MSEGNKVSWGASSDTDHRAGAVVGGLVGPGG